MWPRATRVTPSAIFCDEEAGFGCGPDAAPASWVGHVICCMTKLARTCTCLAQHMDMPRAIPLSVASRYLRPSSYLRHALLLGFSSVCTHTCTHRATLVFSKCLFISLSHVSCLAAGGGSASPRLYPLTRRLFVHHFRPSCFCHSPFFWANLKDIKDKGIKSPKTKMTIPCIFFSFSNLMN